MDVKVIGFTATDGKYARDIYKVTYNPKQNPNMGNINFKFGLVGYQKKDSFKVDFNFMFLADDTKYHHHLNITNPLSTKAAVLNKNGDLFASQFSFDVALPIKESIIKCQMRLSDQNDKILDTVESYFALKDK